MGNLCISLDWNTELTAVLLLGRGFTNLQELGHTGSEGETSGDMLSDSTELAAVRPSPPVKRKMVHR
jgi:hypothetical protein